MKSLPILYIFVIHKNQDQMKIVIYTLLLCVFSLAGCKKRDPLADKTPQASFNIPAKATIGQDIVFENTSTDATSYKWEFGDESMTSDKSPTHSYLGLGTYNVNLTATNDHNGRTSIETKRITVTKRVFTKLIVHDFPIEKMTNEGEEHRLYVRLIAYNGARISETKDFINPTRSDLPITFNLDPEHLEQSHEYVLYVTYMGKTQSWQFINTKFNPAVLTSLHFYNDEGTAHAEIVSRPE